MLDVSPSYLYFCASANTAFLPNEVPLLHQQQHTLLAGSTIFFVNFCHYFPVIMEVSVENTPHRFMAQAK